jgi:ApaG protein
MPTSQAVTRGVRVSVRSQYLPRHSRPDRAQWMFAYTVQITNEGEQTVQLLSRHWVITHSGGEQREVRGPGVVGAQPTLKPGQAFEYTSGCPLPTQVGTMHGTYQMVTPEGDAFDAEIAPFALGDEFAFC